MGLAAWWRERRGGGGAQALDGLRFTVLDSELTGLDERRDDIVSLGAVRMIGGQIHVGGTFHAFVKPTTPLDGRSIVIHGILPGQLEAEPPIDEVLPSFLEYATGTVLVGHCVGIDLAFLTRRSPGADLLGPWIDAHPYIVKAPWRDREGRSSSPASVRQGRARRRRATDWRRV